MHHVARRASEVNTREASEKPDQRFVRLNKNLCNFPLARDPRVKLKWRRFDSGRWYADLPGDEKRIRLILPADVHPSLKRAPTAFDMNVLAYLSSEASRRKGDQIAFPGRGQVLRALGLTLYSDNRRRLDASLAYWSTVTIEFSGCWYQAKERTTLRLEPPLDKVSPSRSLSFTVHFSAQWWDILNRTCFQAIPLPLPADAAAQNLVLACVVSFTHSTSGPYHSGFSRKLGNFCRKIGLDHNNSRQRLKRAAAMAEKWFADHGGELVCRINIEKNDTIWFMAKPPPISRSAYGPEDVEDVHEDDVADDEERIVLDMGEGEQDDDAQFFRTRQKAWQRRDEEW